MKKALLLVSVLILSLFANAQWTDQNSGFVSMAAGIFDIEVVDANVVWAIPYDGSGNGLALQEFTKTIDGGTTWVNGNVAILPLTSSIINISALDVYIVSDKVESLGINLI